MRIKELLTAGALALTIAAPAAAQQAAEKTPAFPGAEGFGRYVTGGRGGAVYRVTNLNDSGEGSLRWALSKPGPRTIVFGVSGTIHLESALDIPGNTTIAGQSAPGDGICVADYPVAIKGNNVIVRYMRFRLGNKYVKKDGADGWDGFGGFDKQDWMIDHCSVSWSIDECLSVLGNKNTTVQWCLVAQSLVNSGHTKGAHGYGGNWGGSGASFHHNLLAHHGSRTPRLGPRPTTQLDERMDMRNNVIYNFGGNGCYGGEAMTVNIVNNYYKPGPGSPTGNKGKRIAGIGIRTDEYVKTYPAYAPAHHIWGKFFVEGNVNSKYSDVTSDNWTYGIYNNIDASGCDGTYTAKTKDTIKLAEPMPFIVTTTHTAAQAYDKVLQYAGASLHRDSFDELMVSDTRNGAATYTGSGLSKGMVNSQDDNRPTNAPADWSAWPTLSTNGSITDTDGDGMPDSWETANGLNPNDASDGNTVGDDGFTMLEVYLNSLVEDITSGQNAGGEQIGDIKEAGEEPVSSEYELSQQTSNGDWTFSNGFKISCSNGYATGTGCGIAGLKYSRNATFKIVIPDGLKVVKAEFKGYSNSDTGTAYLQKLGTQEFASTTYVYPSRKGNKTESYTITLNEPVEGQLPFVFKDAQVVMVIKLFTASTTGIENVYEIKMPSDDRTYNLQGIEVKNPGKGIYIRGGKKVIIK
ncbi:MAG: pectate lyase [Prevotella sp.]|nr:pectate lyase [Prevotella sp.]